MTLPRRLQAKGRQRQRWLAPVFLGLFAQLVPGCLYDSEQPCGAGQSVYGDNVRCVCPEGSAYTPAGCVACGEHEVSGPGGCACEDGYSRATADAPCAEVPSGLGLECDPAAPVCTAPHDHCEPADGAGYCTTAGCASNEDCTGGYACNADGVCQRPPVGLGMACETPDDCAGTEATFCDSFMTHSCQVQGCQVDPNDCFAGFECCDLSAFGLPEPLCIPTGACMP